jgi:hypothetical protein
MNRKNPLPQPGCQLVDRELKDMTLKAEEMLRAASLPPPEKTIAAFASALAQVALWPEIFLKGQFSGAKRNFALCYARRTDTTLKILLKIRRELAKRRRAAESQQAQVLRFLEHNPLVVRCKNKLLRVDKLTAKDFLADGKTLKPPREFVPIGNVQFGELASLLSTKTLNVTADSVKTACRLFSSLNRKHLRFSSVANRKPE